MDPLATLEFITDAHNNHRERAHAVQDLAAWMAKGGAVPICSPCGPIYNDGPSAPYEDEHGDNHDLIAAVNVALVNGDLSGLEGCGLTVLR